MSKSPKQVRGTVCLDFDGVLHEHRGYRWPLGETDFSLITKAQDRGYAAAVMTCNDVRLVAAALRRQGFRATADVRMVREYWHDPVAVLVTNRKISATLYVDDKAVNYQYGQPAEVVFDALDKAEGFHSCPQGRHWGPDGAAGVLPFTVFRGRLYVLMGLRSKHVQKPGTWGGFGGALDHKYEDTWAAAQRELHEEVDGLGGNVTDWMDYYVHDCEACGWRYVTFLAEVPAADPGEGQDAWLPEVRVNDGWESDKVRWVRAGDVEGYELHPGFALAWPELRRRLGKVLEVSAA